MKTFAPGPFLEADTGRKAPALPRCDLARRPAGLGRLGSWPFLPLCGGSGVVYISRRFQGCSQFGRVVSYHGVRVQAEVLAAGHIQNPAPDVLAPDPEGREICPERGQLVGHCQRRGLTAFRPGW